MDHRLIERLHQTGLSPMSLALEDGATLLVLPYGGRVLALYPASDQRSFLWANPALKDEASMREFFGRSGWLNSGGDRTWLAPEIDLFFPHFPDLTTYLQPPTLDPGSYQVHQDEKSIHLGMEFEVTPKSTGQPVCFRVSKAICSSANPVGNTEGVSYAGYETHVVLEAITPLTSPIGQWQLLQLPHGGEMIVSTCASTNPLVVFGNPPAEHLRVEDRAIRYRMSADGDHKISIQAHACTGRVGYLCEAEETFQLVVRNFFINPSGQYVDANWSDASDDGYGVQACCVKGPRECFSELEYHVPTMTPCRPRSEDTSQVWAYRGPREVLNRIAEKLLGTSF